MEFFTKTKAIKLRSHLDKYLIAEEDGLTIRQSRDGSTLKARWIVELVDGRTDAIRLKTVDGRYLTASGLYFLFGMTGKRVVQTLPKNVTNRKLLWEPISDGFQVKLKSCYGKFLRANGGTPPWRNAVTHDEPQTCSPVRWILWDVEVVEDVRTESFAEYLSSTSSFCSVSEDFLEDASDECWSELESPLSILSSVRTPRLTIVQSFSRRLCAEKPNFYQFQSGMEFFRNAKVVLLRSHHNKYLYAGEDEESVDQNRNGFSNNARWTVEFVPGSNTFIRLKSCYGKYLTATDHRFLLSMSGRKVLQTSPARLDSSTEWEPIREGTQVKLKTRYGNFLRANGGLPPWKNSVIHDISHRTASQNWVLWDVNIVEVQVVSSRQDEISHLDSLDFESSSPSSFSIQSAGTFSRQESIESTVSSPPKSEGRIIFYHVADESGEVDDDDNEVMEVYYFHFKGNGVDELTLKLREETGLEDIIVCSRSPLDGKLYPLRLQLPPNNGDMHVVVVDSSYQGEILF